MSLSNTSSSSLPISSSVYLKLHVEFCSESATIGEIAKEPAFEEECSLGKKKQTGSLKVNYRKGTWVHSTLVL
jgi:hypothetical protein